MRDWFLIYALLLCSSFFMVIYPGNIAYSDDDMTIEGFVTNGTPGSSIPEKLEIELHAEGSDGKVSSVSTLNKDDGQFIFYSVDTTGVIRYQLQTTYQDVIYSIDVEPSDAGKLLGLTIYELTDSLSDIVIESEILLIKRVTSGIDSVRALGLINLSNFGSYTFIPDFSEPRFMKFLRFGLPNRAIGLEIDSNLPQGNVINVGTGFAISSHVPPGSYRLLYNYSIEMEDTVFDLSRSFPMGTSRFRLLVDNDIGDLEMTPNLISLADITIEDKVYKVWESEALGEGDIFDIYLYGTNQTANKSVMSKLTNLLTDVSYWRFGIPITLGIILIGFVAYSLFYMRNAKDNRTVKSESLSCEEGSGDTLQYNTSITHDLHSEPNKGLMDQLSLIHGKYILGDLEEADYLEKRNRIVQQIIVSNYPDQDMSNAE